MRRFLTAAILAAIAIPAAAQVDVDKTVVTVNGESIKGAEYYRRMEFLPGVGKKVGSGIAEFPPGFLTIEQLITERIVFQLAKQKGVYPSDLEVQADLKARVEDQPKLMETWKATGRSEAELLNQIRFELARYKLQGYGITITDQEVEKYYNDNPATYTVPKQVKLRVIVVDTDAKKALVDKELAAGKQFAEVAKAQSVDLTKDSGGQFGTYPITMLAPEIRQTVDSVKAGQVAPWVGGTQNGVTRHARFLVEAVAAPKKMPLDAKLKRTIRQEITLMKGAARNDLEKEMREARAKAKIEITNPEFASAYKMYMDAYLKQGK